MIETRAIKPTSSVRLASRHHKAENVRGKPCVRDHVDRSYHWEKLPILADVASCTVDVLL